MVASVNYKQIKIPSTNVDTNESGNKDAYLKNVSDYDGLNSSDNSINIDNIKDSVNNTHSSIDNNLNKLNTSWLENQIKSCKEASTYLFFRVEEHELKSQELFDKIAKQEVKKRLLESFYKRYKEIKNITNEIERNEALRKLNKEFLDTQTLSNELDKYTKSSATKEFLLKILKLEDYNQLRLALIAITGCGSEATKILSSNIGLFEDYVEDRAKFARAISKIQNEYKNGKSVKDIVNETLSKAV